MRGQQDQQSRVFCELSSLVFDLLRSPPSRRSPAETQITPSGFASLLLGISVSLMLCGWVTFFIGFMLMPWVLGLVMVLYVAGILSSLSLLGRSILCYATPRKDLSGVSFKSIKIGISGLALGKVVFLLTSGLFDLSSRLKVINSLVSYYSCAIVALPTLLEIQDAGLGYFNFNHHSIVELAIHNTHIADKLATVLYDVDTEFAITTQDVAD